MERVLIIEDDEDIRYVIQSQLKEAFSLELVMAESGNRAIEILKRDKNFILIISDYMMPEGTGLDVLRFKLDQRLNIPFIFFTNTVDPYIPFSETDYLGVIDKWIPEDLIALVAKILASFNPTESL